MQSVKTTTRKRTPTTSELAAAIREAQKKAVEDARANRNARGKGRAGNGTGARPKPGHTGLLGQYKRGGKRTRKLRKLRK